MLSKYQSDIYTLSRQFPNYPIDIIMKVYEVGSRPDSRKAEKILKSHSPSQFTNHNTEGILRQLFPTSTDADISVACSKTCYSDSFNYLLAKIGIEKEKALYVSLPESVDFYEVETFKTFNLDILLFKKSTKKQILKGICQQIFNSYHQKISKLIVSLSKSQDKYYPFIKFAAKLFGFDDIYCFPEGFSIHNQDLIIELKNQNIVRAFQQFENDEFISFDATDQISPLMLKEIEASIYAKENKKIMNDISVDEKTTNLIFKEFKKLFSTEYNKSKDIVNRYSKKYSFSLIKKAIDDDCTDLLNKKKFYLNSETIETFIINQHKDITTIEEDKDQKLYVKESNMPTMYQILKNQNFNLDSSNNWIFEKREKGRDDLIFSVENANEYSRPLCNQSIPICCDIDLSHCLEAKQIIIFLKNQKIEQVNFLFPKFWGGPTKLFEVMNFITVNYCDIEFHIENKLDLSTVRLISCHNKQIFTNIKSGTKKKYTPEINKIKDSGSKRSQTATVLTTKFFEPPISSINPEPSIAKFEPPSASIINTSSTPTIEPPSSSNNGPQHKKKYKPFTQKLEPPSKSSINTQPAEPKAEPKKFEPPAELTIFEPPSKPKKFEPPAELTAEPKAEPPSKPTIFEPPSKPKKFEPPAELTIFEPPAEPPSKPTIFEPPSELVFDFSSIIRQILRIQISIPIKEKNYTYSPPLFLISLLSFPIRLDKFTSMKQKLLINSNENYDETYLKVIEVAQNCDPLLNEFKCRLFVLDCNPELNNRDNFINATNQRKVVERESCNSANDLRNEIIKFINCSTGINVQIHNYSPKHQMVISSCYVLKASWEFNFKEYKSPLSWYYFNGSDNPIPFCYVDNKEFLFYEDSAQKYSIISIPFKGKKRAMTLFRPKNKKILNNLMNLMNLIDESFFKQLISQMKKETISRLVLPNLDFISKDEMREKIECTNSIDSFMSISSIKIDSSSNNETALTPPKLEGANDEDNALFIPPNVSKVKNCQMIDDIIINQPFLYIISNINNDQTISNQIQYLGICFDPNNSDNQNHKTQNNEGTQQPNQNIKACTDNDDTNTKYLLELALSIDPEEIDCHSKLMKKGKRLNMDSVINYLYEEDPRYPKKLIEKIYLSNPIPEPRRTLKIMARHDPSDFDAKTIRGRLLCEYPFASKKIIETTIDQNLNTIDDYISYLRGIIMGKTFLNRRENKICIHTIAEIDLHPIGDGILIYLITKKMIDIAKKNNIDEIQFISGKGNHSKGIPKLRRIVNNISAMEGIKSFVNPSNQGVLIVRMTNNFYEPIIEKPTRNMQQLKQRFPNISWYVCYLILSVPDVNLESAIEWATPLSNLYNGTYDQELNDLNLNYEKKRDDVIDQLHMTESFVEYKKGSKISNLKYITKAKRNDNTELLQRVIKIDLSTVDRSRAKRTVNRFIEELINNNIQEICLHNDFTDEGRKQQEKMIEFVKGKKEQGIDYRVNSVGNLRIANKNRNLLF